MIYKNIHQWGKSAITLCAAAAIALGVSYGGSAAAAPPYTVSYNGTAVTTAAPGKPFTLKFQVKNTGSTVYSGVKVIFHIPNELESSQVSPGDATIEDGIISWNNVPINAGKSFYPTFTFTMDRGTPLKTKVSIWVEVTGTDMEANSKNFSVTAKSTTTAKVTTTLSSADVTAIFKSVYGRTPTASELKYWLGRRTDKPQRASLLGAIAYHKALNIKH